MRRMLFSITAVLIILCSQAQAFYEQDGRCQKRDLKGQWVSYQAEVLKNPHSGVCKFEIEHGKVEGKCDFSLTDDQGNPLTGLQFIGDATIKDDCSAELTMDFRPFGRPFVSTFQLQFHSNKKSFVGRWENTFGALGTANGVKL
ncbi:MAG: hypothetical protein Q7U76_17025 [Nitrospirota bacterium]|nr:hypothetical protein [Nitrospirota bacterium]